MGVYGTIVICPFDSKPPNEVDGEALGRRLLRVFEDQGMVLPGTCDALKAQQGAGVSFEQSEESGLLAPGDCVTLTVEPEQLTAKMGELVYLLDVDENDNPAPIELPYVSVVISKKTAPVTILGLNTGDLPRETWAVIEFDYEDARLSEEIHRIRDENHPVFAALRKAFACDVAWGVIAG